MELVVVLAILAMVGGLSIGVYQKVATQNVLPTAASQVSSILRAARNFSVSSGLPSRVYVDEDAGQVSAFGFELVAAWSFEDLEELEIGAPIDPGFELIGAFGERAEVQGEIEVGTGRIGCGLAYLDDGAHLVAPNRPRYDSSRGFSLDAWVLFWPRELARGEGSDRSGAWSDPRRSEEYAVISRPGSYEFGLLGDGALYAVIGDADDLNSTRTYFAATASQAVLGWRWTHIRASFDGIELILEVDGISRGWAPVGFEYIAEDDWPPMPEEVPATRDDLLISHPSRFFFGEIDEVKVRVALEPRVYELPGEVKFLGGSQLIRFDSRGSLDPVHHGYPVLVRIGELGEDAQTEEEAGGGTAVAAPSPFEALGGSPSREGAGNSQVVDEAIGDPMSALQRYFDEKRVELEDGRDSSAGEDFNRVSPGIGERGEGDLDRGMKRIHRIIVDLTGTIRG